MGAYLSLLRNSFMALAFSNWGASLESMNREGEGDCYKNISVFSVSDTIPEVHGIYGLNLLKYNNKDKSTNKSHTK